MLAALKFSLGHSGKHVLRSLRLYGDQALGGTDLKYYFNSFWKCDIVPYLVVHGWPDFQVDLSLHPSFTVCSRNR